MDKEKRQDILIKVCCVIASLALWIYIRGTANPITTHSIKYVPVRLINEDVLAQSDLTLVPGQELTVNLNVKGPSTAIDNLDKDRDFEIVADLSKYVLKPGENKIYIEVKKKPDDITVLNGEGVLVKVNVDSLNSKDVNTTSKIIGTPSVGFYADEPIISPPSVVVSGGKTYVDKIVNVIAEIDITNANLDIDKTIKLKAIDASGRAIENVKISPEYAQVKVPIRKGKTVNIEVKTFGGTTNGASVESFELNPKTVEIIGSNEIIEKISSIQTQPIDLSKINGDTTVDAKLALPEGVKLTKQIDAIKVKVVLRKAAQKTFKVTIKTKNLGKDLNGTLDKTIVDVVLSGLESDLNNVTEDSLSAIVDLNGLSEGEHNVAVIVGGIPGGVQKVSQSVANVKATIKKATEVISNNVN